jgi:hypothetical protein
VTGEGKNSNKNVVKLSPPLGEDVQRTGEGKELRKTLRKLLRNRNN